jgi:hypothetical protein
MKHRILTCAVAALFATPSFAANKDTSSSSVVTTADGTATITIDVNGKKETKTFKLGDGVAKVDVKDGKLIAEPGKKQKVTFFGVSTDSVSEELRAHLPLKSGEGITVNHVAADSPAAKAGILEHDILIRMEDQILVEPQQLKTLVKMRKPGDQVKVTLLRKGEQKEVTLTLAETEEREINWPAWNLEGSKLDENIRRQLGDAQKRLKQIDPKLGSVLHRKGIVIGPDGKTHTFDGADLKEIVETARKQLKDSGLKDEQIDSIVETLKGAVKDAPVRELSELFGKPKKDGPDDRQGVEKDGKNVPSEGNK